MNYIVEYEITSLVFLIALMVKFYEAKRFPNKLYVIFGFIMHLAVADISLDIVSSYMIMYSPFLPRLLVYVVNSAFYILQFVFIASMLFYTLVMTKNPIKSKLGYFLLSLPAAIFLVDLLFVNPFFGNLFYLDEAGNYIHGESFRLMYSSAVFYIIATFTVVILNRKTITKEQNNVIIIFLIMLTVSVVVQFIFPSLLVTGVAATLGILMMYFTLQNPDDMTDVVTGAFNYEALIEFLNERTSELAKYKLIAIEIGGMRQLNALLGLEAGNIALKNVAVYLAGMRKKAWVFRVFGTRFIMLTYDDEDCGALIEKLTARFSEPWPISGSELILTATIRYFTSSDEYGSAEEIVNLLDEIFNSSKLQLGSTRSIDKEFISQINRGLQIESALRTALDTFEGFYLVYQPIFSVKEQRFSSAEVLLRFKDEQLGSVSPGEFIPIAEKNGLIIEIDEMVVKKACEFIERIDPKRTLGIRSVSVNLSAAEFLTQNFPERLKKIVTSYNIDPEDITFEITETAAGAAGNILHKYMNDMNKDGFYFAMDDFGTGYSNITQIVNLPFSTVKFDRSLLVNENGNDTPYVLFETLLRVFKELGYKTIVEGVETLSQLEKIRNIEDVDYIQGFYYATPMTEEILSEFLVKC